MKAKVRMSRELAKILEEANSEVEKWPQWQRSLDPQGAELDLKNDSEEGDSDAEESAA